MVDRSFEYHRPAGRKDLTLEQASIDVGPLGNVRWHQIVSWTRAVGSPARPGVERQPRLAPWIVEGHAQYPVPYHGFRDGVAIEGCLRPARPVMHAPRHLVPPRLESTLARIKVDVDPGRCLHTAHLLPKGTLPGIRHAVPIVGINRPAAV